uniref:Lipoxygenase domain-containing protein n=2 Tax=Hordeum vulgare subsp. vulgare TaxID=112509 RepID=A0A8I6Z4A2_HORVV
MSVLHGICRIMKLSKHSSQSFPTLDAINAMYDDQFRNQPVQPDGGRFKFIAEFLEKEAVLLFEQEGAEFFEGIRRVFKFETPEIHDRDKFAWFRDEEFARETLAGMNPLSIQLVRAVAKKKLFMLDYHDLYLPFVNKVRQLEGTTLYGARALFFLAGDDTLRPIAIELTRPKSASKPQWREVFTPASAHEASITGSWQWQLAKAHVVSLDTGYHQLVSHWLRTHCCVEPYIIAANRQLSQMHPIYRLLHPSFRFTMEINAQARSLLINADGIIESTFSPGKYSMDGNQLGGLRRAVAWAFDYVAHYYPGAADIVDDVELQAWWDEVRTKGHADKKDEPWWPKLDCHESLVQTLSTIMWVASAHHAAVNFSQYPFGGYVPNRPYIARINMPSEMGADGNGMHAFMEAPDKVLLDTLPSQHQSALVMAILDLLSSHSSGEEYLGTYQDPAWEQNGKINKAFEDQARP